MSKTVELTYKKGVSLTIAQELQRYDHLREDFKMEKMESLLRIQKMLSSEIENCNKLKQQHIYQGETK